MTTLFRLLLVSALAASHAPAQSPFDYDARLPLDLRDSLWQTQEGIEIRAISFASPKGGRVTGLLYLPTTPAPHPGVVLGHGAPGNSRGFRTVELGLALARSGAVVLAIDAPFARRNAPPLSFTPSDSADQIHLIVDFRRGVDLLSNRPDVDRSRLGYLGNSYGGAQGALLVGVEPRITAAVLRVADGGFLAHFSDPCDEGARGPETIAGCLRWSIAEEDLPAAQRERWVASLRPIEPIQFVGNTRAKLLLQSGRQDDAVTPARARRLHATVPPGATVEWYDSGHRLPPGATLSAVAFLARHLGLSAPSEALADWLEARAAVPASPLR